MAEINMLRDASFLRELDKENLKTYYVKIEVLDFNEIPIRAIEGRVNSGSISIDGSSSVRRSGNISFIAEDAENDLTDVDNLLSINKKIKIQIGLENNIDEDHDEIIWFKQGIFLITQPSIQHTVSGVTINLQFKDKMCLLNGDLGGNLPTSVCFDSYDQYLGILSVDALPQEPSLSLIYLLTTDQKYYMWDSIKGWYTIDETSITTDMTTSIPQTIFDIVQTAVCNYGSEAISKIIINDIERESKFLVRYTGSDSLYYNESTGEYRASMPDNLTKEESAKWRTFNYNEECGYIYSDFVYSSSSGSLTTGIGDNVCSVLDKIVEKLGNYEYFYDIDGNFVFQEKKNYLNTSYDPVQEYNPTEGSWTHLLSADGNILNNDNYFVDFSDTGESTYTFEDGNNLISSYSNSPSYTNIKNDYHIWGKTQDGNALHYHVAIKKKPEKTTWYADYVNEDGTKGAYVYNVYDVYYCQDTNGEENGRVCLEKPDYLSKSYEYDESTLVTTSDAAYAEQTDALVVLTSDYTTNFNDSTSTLELYDGSIVTTHKYVPEDWRAELYMQGLTKKKLGIRPDIYEQELLDLFDSIYDMKENKFKDIADVPNNLNYWFDYLDPVGELQDISVDSIGSKIYSYQQDNIIKLYSTDVPDRILINQGTTSLTINNLVNKCLRKGQKFSNIESTLYSQTSIGSAGYTAQEVARSILYEYTDFNSSISISCVPIYYLEPNTRITVFDRASGISGDFIISSISLPLDGKSTMTINATKALQRV